MGLPVFFLSMICQVLFHSQHSLVAASPGTLSSRPDLLALTIPVQFGIGLRFYRTSWKAIKHGSATMDVLIVIGTTASWVFSVFS